MTVQDIQTGVLYGVSGDTKPTNHATNTIFLEQDTGNIYRYSGSSWDLFRGASKAEELTNKTIDAADQTDVRKMLAADFVRETGVYYSVPPGQNSSGWLLGLTLFGSITLQVVDSSHGLTSNVVSATTANTSQAGYRSQNAFTYSAWSPYFRLKCAVSDISTNNRFFFGFSNNTTTPTSNTFLSTTTSGVGIGMRSSDSPFTVFNNDGGGGAMATTSTGVTADTAVHSYEIQFDNSIPNCVVKLDGVTKATLTTQIPASGTALMLYFFVEPTTTSARTLKLYNSWYEHKRTVTPL